MGLYIHDIIALDKDGETLKTWRKGDEVIEFLHGSDVAAYLFGIRDGFNVGPNVPNGGEVDPSEWPEAIRYATEHRELITRRITREEIKALDPNKLIKSMYDQMETDRVSTILGHQWLELQSLLEIEGSETYYILYS